MFYVPKIIFNNRDDSVYEYIVSLLVIPVRLSNEVVKLRVSSEKRLGCTSETIKLNKSKTNDSFD